MLMQLVEQHVDLFKLNYLNVQAATNSLPIIALLFLFLKFRSYFQCDITKHVYLQV